MTFSRELERISKKLMEASKGTPIGESSYADALRYVGERKRKYMVKEDKLPQYLFLTGIESLIIAAEMSDDKDFRRNVIGRVRGLVSVAK